MTATVEGGWPRAVPKCAVPERTFPSTLFGSLNDTAPRPVEWSVHDMAKELTRFTVLPNKEAAELFSPASFREGGSRRKDDVESISMLVLDADHVSALDAPIQKLEALGYVTIWYTTFRHAPEAPRFRIIVLLAQPVSAKDWEVFYPTAAKWIGEKIGVEFDRSVKDGSRFFFLPNHAPGADHRADVFHEFDGKLLDPQPMIDAGREKAEQLEAERKARRVAIDAEAKKTGKPSAIRHYIDTAIDDQLADLASVQPGTQSNALNSAAFSLASLLAGGDLLAEWPDIEGRMVHIVVNVWMFSREPWTEHAALKTIRSGYNAGVMEPRDLSCVGTWQAEDTAGGWARPQPAPEPEPETEPDHGVEPDTAEAGQKKQPETGPQLVTRRTLTDTGNAELFVELNRNVAKYAPGLDWVIWDVSRWAVDGDGRALDLTKGVAEWIRLEAERLQSEEPSEPAKASAAKQALVWAKQSESHGKRAAMLNLARVERSVVVNVGALDSDPYLLNVENGTFNLQSGVMRPHNRDDLITKMAPVTYRPGAQCPRWLEFLKRIFAGDRDLIAFVQRFAGYSLTGDTEEHAFAILFGQGANGKSTLTEVLAAIAGDYAAHTPLETFTADRQSSSTSNALARLRGARSVFGTELNAGARLAEATIKQVTGGDVISARFLYREYIEFQPRFKLWMVTNHRPRVGTDEGMFRRIRLIPFVVTIPPAERDPKLKASLLEEKSGILNWLLEGVAQWRRNRLGTCDAVRAGTNQYQADMDPLADFLEQCARIKPSARVNAGVFYQAYCEFAKQEGDKPMSHRALTRHLKLQGIEAKPGRVRTYVGIDLKEEE
jgi:putative DNA primase/helicase